MDTNKSETRKREIQAEFEKESGTTLSGCKDAMDMLDWWQSFAMWQSKKLIAAEEEIAAKNQLLLNISTYAVKTSVLSNEEIYDARKDAERVVKDAEMCIKSKGA